MIESEDGGADVPPPRSTPLPKLHCLVGHGDTIKADLIAAMPAAIIARDRLYYFEVAAMSDSTAHAIAGALAESRVDAQWSAKGVPLSGDWKPVQVGAHVTIRDTRLPVPQFSGRLHHVAVLDTSGDLILADNDNTLWAKLRSRMTCPTLEPWGKALMPAIHKSGLLVPALSYGFAAELKAYILAADATAIFDSIVTSHVLRIRGFRHVREAAMQEAA